MTPGQPHEVVEFAKRLAELEEVLTRNGADTWAGKIARARQLAENADGYSTVVVLRLFGGMGSLGDLVLSAPEAENRALSRLRSQVFAAAHALRQ